MNASFIPIFETKSNRVKGVSFHPTRPWILAALHNGSVQLWDYRIKTLLDRFEEHDGPVRGVCFHPNQPLFVSGGDDYKIKVWNYKERRCLFTLLGHLDYIRTVEFHHEYPWILSASDDQTIRIWNWQSRTCITVLTGHSHYVMCAKFHPTEDLVVSASLDSTVRVWDIGGLRKKNVIPQHESDGMKLQNELFGNTDAIVKYVLEGHDRGVNWAAFHPTLPLIISGADDRQIKLWRMSETKAWEVDTMRGHYNNVSCCIFHPKLDLMVSDGEDKSIRIWDMSKRTLLLTHRREHDRFWILTSHPQRNLFAAGHDSGFVIFKLEKERPALAVVPGEAVFYIKDRYIRAYEFATGRDVPVLTLRKRDASARNIQYNKAEQTLIVNFIDAENQGFYELYSLPKNRTGTAVESAADSNKRGSGKSAVWFSRNKFAVLDKHGSVHLRDGQGSDVKLETSYAVDAIFTAPSGQLLLKVDDRAILYDVARKTEVAETAIPSGVKFVEWSGHDANSLVAFMSKDTVVVTNAKLEVMSTIAERTRIKSGVWDDNGIFIYCTMGHIKYSLPIGDHGIVRTLDQPIYLTSVKGNKIFCLDRECRNRGVTVDTTEYMFKQALVQKRFGEVLKMVRGANLVGQSIIGYLQQKGFPEVALHFVKDERTRFELALECGNIEIARDSAEKLGDPDAFRKLGREALRQGHQEWVEESYMRTNDCERLSFLYSITGNLKNLRRMEGLAVKRKDVNSRFHNALLLGDAAERVNILEETGQLPLAYLTAKTHGLQEDAARLYEKINSRNHDYKVQQIIQAQNLSEAPDLPIEDIAAKIRGVEKPRLLLPPIPIVRNAGNWPQLTVSRGPFEAPTVAAAAPSKLQAGGPASAAPRSAIAAAADLDDEDESGWGEELDIGKPAGANGTDTGATAEEGGATGEEEGNAWDDLDLPDLPKPAKKTGSAAQGKATPQINLPREGPSWPSLWCVNSDLPADHVAAGSFESAMQLLNQQIGATNFAPMKQYFMRLCQGSQARLVAQPSTASLELFLLRNPESAGSRDGLPQLAITVSELIDKVQLGYRATTAGKFQEALEHFKAVLSALPLVLVNSSQELSEVKEILTICTEYVVGIQTELKRKDLLAQKGDPVRIAELAAYFTHVNLQPVHLQLTLRSAMTICIKLKNYRTAYGFGRRLLDLSSNKPDVIEKTQQAMELCEQNGLQDEIRLNYDERNPFVICAMSYTPIYRGTQSSTCSYCPAQFKPEFNDRQCTVCNIGKVGVRGTGMVVTRSRKPMGGPGARGPRQQQQQHVAQPQQAQEDDYDF